MWVYIGTFEHHSELDFSDMSDELIAYSVVYVMHFKLYVDKTPKFNKK
jgi:hypothetical protein